MDSAVAGCTNIVITSDGKRVCEDTGVILSESTFADYGPSTRDRSSLAESRAPISYKTHDMNIGAKIVDFSRKRNPLSRARSRRARYRTSSISKSDVPTITALQRLKETAEVLNLPDSVHETAAMILRHFLGQSARKPGNLNTYVAAAVVKAVEVHGIPISRGEICRALGVSESAVQKAALILSDTHIVRMLTRKSIKNAKSKGTSVKLERIDEFINRLVTNLDLGYDVKKLAMEFVRTSLRAEGYPGRKNFDGKKSAALAAAAVYLAARLLGHDLSQKKVAKVLELRESNIRKHYRFLMDNVAIVVYV
ncbi:MAG: transcription initiation factor IIB family protein [Aeropyrum sp.]|nr:transcription initiation factor IIB family protein [Aeropyrum sp.]MCE4615796.1 transcription initiation factor IIB family protein [Aeropyrum sp.]